MSIAVTTEDIRAVVETLWSTIPDEAPPGLVPAPPTGIPGAVTARVYVHGAWVGAVALAVSPALARRVAASLLALAVHDVGPSDAADTVAELANIVAGNLKSLLGCPCVISLPALSGAALDAPSLSATFASRGERFAVTIHEGARPDGASPTAPPGEP